MNREETQYSHQRVCVMLQAPVLLMANGGVCVCVHVCVCVRVCMDVWVYVCVYILQEHICCRLL